MKPKLVYFKKIHAQGFGYKALLQDPSTPYGTASE